MIIVVTGMAFEARIVEGPETIVVCGGGRGDLARVLGDLIGENCRGLMSFGLCGGLDPALSPGDMVIASHIADGQHYNATDPAWTARLRAALPDSKSGIIAGVASAVVTAQAKSELYRRTEAIAVDMESQAVARVATDRRLPFVTLRAVADPASRGLPPSAMKGMRADGNADTWAVLRSLMQRPGDLPGLIRTARDAQAARAALLRCRHRLGPGLLGS